MDVAYDHIQEETLRSEDPAGRQEKEPEGTLNSEIQEAYKAISSSPWGARLGGFLGSVRKQGESYIQGARQEAVAVSGEAFKGFTDLKTTLVSRARSMSIEETAAATSSVNDAAAKTSTTDGEDTATKQRSESEALRESEGLIARFRTEAAKRLKDIEKAEDAADEALLKFGTNIRNFLRDAVSVAPPSKEKDKDGKGKVLFESKDQDGKRVFHTTRFDAQLHVIHCSLDSFTKDPVSPEYEKWKTGDFDVEKKTEEIAADLERYEELRRAMEKLVPEQVEYAQFWKRYYFLRMVIESEESRRREMLKGAALHPVEEVGWDNESDSEPGTPQPRTRSSTTTPAAPSEPSSTDALTSSASTMPSAPQLDSDLLKPGEARKSQDQNSQADSDASYDLVSGATSHAPGSPREEKERERRVGRQADESDEEDWE